MNPKNILTLDVRQVPFWRRLTLILASLDALTTGAALELVADLDPQPLRQYLDATHPEAFDWCYLESGPEVWRISVARKA